MRLEENPFYILGASIYDDKNKIQELAEDKSFFDDEDSGDIYERAATALTNPKKRLAAEMRWFIGCDSAQEKEIVERFDDHFYYAKKYPSILAEMNFNIYALSYQNLDAETVLLIGALYDKLDLAEIKNLLNTAREISGFPPIRDVAEIKSEFKNIRDEIRRTIHANIKKFTLSEYLKMAEELVYYQVTGGVVEDFFSKIYSVDMSPRLDEYESKLVGVLKSLEDNPSEDNFKTLEGLLNILTEILRPLYAMSKLIDTVKDEHSEKIFSVVRRLAKYLRNEKDLINEPIRIIKILSLKFNYVDSLKKIADEDIKILEQIQQDYLQLEKVTDSSKKILELVESIRRNPSLALINSLTKELTFFTDSTNGLDDIEDLREAMFKSVYSTAIDLYNEKNLIDEPLQILKTLSKCFWRIPEIKSRLDEDIKALEEDKANQPTKTFEEAENILNEIFQMLGKKIHLEQNFQWENFKVYEDFQKNYEWKVLDCFKLAGYKPKEWADINLIVAAIYNRLSMGLAYAERFDLAKVFFEKALQYALISDNDKMLSMVQKNLDDCKKILSQQKSNSSGCMFFIIAIVTALLFGIF